MGTIHLMPLLNEGKVVRTDQDNSKEKYINKSMEAERLSNISGNVLQDANILLTMNS